jgi:SAM-dependent methyltransferase
VKCNFCKSELTHVVCDLGHQPPSNAFLTREQLDEPEITYPLRAYVCDKCWLVQVPDYGREMFTDNYPYYSSQSPANVSHAKEYVDMMVERFGLNNKSFVMEIGSNDGYLLQWFQHKEIRCLGFEPSDGPFIVSLKKGITTSPYFFGSKEANRIQIGHGKADLICGINVLAHQPDINDFVEGMRIALAPEGIITMEFPHLVSLINGLQFDTIYHEHYSYFSLAVIERIFKDHGLRVFNVEKLDTHGGSLRIYACHHGANLVDDYVYVPRTEEAYLGVESLSFYANFQNRVNEIRHDALGFLLYEQFHGETIAYGAAAKGNTFLNFCGIREDMITAVVDRSPHKQGKYLPGSHTPVISENRLKEIKPQYIAILAWNLKEEIMEQLSYAREWGAKFVTFIPALEVL